MNTLLKWLYKTMLVGRRLLWVSVLMALTCSFSQPGYAADECSAAGFQVSSSLTLEGPPYGVASADLNGDGHLDLATSSNNEITILFGRGAPQSFGPPISFPAGVKVSSVRVGDFNSDGKLDLLVITSVSGNTGSVSVLLGDGNGNFGAPNTTSLNALPYHLVVSDFNSDGNLLPSPVRLLDTRPGQPACDTPGVPLTAGGTRTQPARTACSGIAATAQAIVGNATVVNNEAGAGRGFITLFPNGGMQPTVSNLNYVSGQIVPNAFTVGLGRGDGAFNVFATTSTHFLIDLTGYFAP